MDIVNYLKSFDDSKKALIAIHQKYNIEIHQNNNFVLLNYGIDSPHNPICDDCRALILKIPDWDVVSFSFRRFYNYHEYHAVKIDWSTAKVYEKLDGSLVVFFHYGQQWRMQTRGTIDAIGELPDKTGTFNQHIMLLLANAGFNSLQDFMTNVPHNWCYVMEYVGPHNRVVTPYITEQLYLLAITDKSNQSYIDISRVVRWPFAYPQEYKLTSIEEIMKSIDKLPKLHEGYVISDAHGNFVKVKNPVYLAVSHLINAGSIITDKHFVTIAIRKDVDEIKAYFPNLVERIEYFENIIQKLTQEAEEAWLLNKDAPDQKSFALKVKDLPFSAWLFLKRAGKTKLAAREWTSSVKPEFVLKSLEKTSPAK